MKTKTQTAADRDARVKAMIDAVPTKAARLAAAAAASAAVVAAAPAAASADSPPAHLTKLEARQYISTVLGPEANSTAYFRKQFGDVVKGVRIFPAPVPEVQKVSRSAKIVPAGVITNVNGVGHVGNVYFLVRATKFGGYTVSLTSPLR